MRLEPRAAKALTQRRARLQLSLRTAAARSGISVGTWQRLEGGDEVAYRSLVRAVDALGWPPAAVDLLSAGGAPDDSPPPAGPAAAGALDEELELAALIGELSPEGKAAAEAYIRFLRSNEKG